MVLVEDFYRAARPQATDKQRLRAARTLVVVVGLLNIVTALILVQTKGSALSLWFAVSAIASGGLAGLFFLAFLTRRATKVSAWTGIACATAFTFWAVLSKGAKPFLDLGSFNYPWDDLTIGAFGNIILFTTGLLASLFTAPETTDDRGTFWHWRATRQPADVSAKEAMHRRTFLITSASALWAANEDSPIELRTNTGKVAASLYCSEKWDKPFLFPSARCPAK